MYLKMGIRMITDTKTFLLSINTMVFPSLLRMDELCTEPGFILTATIYSVNSHPKQKLQLRITRPLTCFQKLCKVYLLSLHNLSSNSTCCCCSWRRKEYLNLACSHSSKEVSVVSCNNYLSVSKNSACSSTA